MDNIKVKIRDVAYIDLLDAPIQQAVPQIQVGENGLITATSIQEKGSVVGGITRSEYQLPIEEGKTIVPNREMQLVIPKNHYSTGDILVSPIVTQEKDIELTDDGSYSVVPDDKYVLSKVNVKVDTSEKRNEAYEAGKKAEYDAFWDAYQDNGNRLNYGYGFGGQGWTNQTFKPKYIIRPTYAYGIFNNSKATNYMPCDLSQCTDFRAAFSQCYFEHIGVIDASSATLIDSAFYRMYNCHTIDKLIMHEGVTSAGTAFNLSSALVNITIEGVIGCSIDIHWSPLSFDSITSIITHLSDTATGQTLTLSKAAVDKTFATGTATYQFNEDDTEMVEFLGIENYNEYPFNFRSDGKSYTTLIASGSDRMQYGTNDIDSWGDRISDTAYDDGWVSSAYKTISIQDTSELDLSFARYLIKMTKRTSNDSLLNNGSTSAEWQAWVASKPNWTISLI